MKLKTIVALAAALSVPVHSLLAVDDRDQVIQTLLEKVDQLEQKVKVLERNRELDVEADEVRKKETPLVSAGASGFTIRSGDSNFVLRVRGGLQADARFFMNDTPANDTFLLRRVRPAFEGTVFEKFDYRLMLDLASGISATPNNNGFILDANANARLWPQFQIQAGKFKEPVGLERLQSWQNLLFAERGFPTQLVPNRDAGIMLHGELFDGRLNYAAGVFNGTADGGSNDLDTDDDKDFAARIFAHPFKNSDLRWFEGLGVGIAGTIGDHSGELRGYSSPGQQRFFSYLSGTGAAGSPTVTADGETWRISPQGYYYHGPFGLLGEYVVSNSRVRRDAGGSSTFSEIENTAWQVGASYFLTGEENSFKPVTPKHPFSLGTGNWGAWEVAARVGELDVDDGAFPLFSSVTASATKALSWGIGLNWHLNRNFKVTLNYENTSFDGGAANPALRDDEHLFLSRAQITF